MKITATARIGLAVLVLAGFAFGGLERGNRYYRQGDYARAVEEYRQAVEDGTSSPELYYNLGTALLQLRRYDEAEQAFRDALSAVDPSLRQRTFYNLGNRFLVAGRQTKDVQAAGKLLNAAVETYKQALRLAPPDSAAKWNLELALQEKKKNDEKQKQEGQSQNPQSQGQSGASGGGGGQARSNPSPGGGQGQSPSGEGMTQADAARLLNAIEQNERSLFKQSLKKGRSDRTTERNW